MIRGRIYKFSDNVDTDQIYPGKYLEITNPNIIAQHCMEGISTNFAQEFKKGSIFVTGKNFGCGSSREHAAIAIKRLGVSCIIAPSFARIFYRNAINCQRRNIFD
jgi:3-isopropylmalate/(R)-2-methylmalate dehydratase small subunit